MTKKYIDAEKLREKIEEQMDTLPREVGRGAGTITSKGYGMMQAFQIVRSIIDSLQQEQPEVDFEKEWEEFENWMESYNQGDYPTCYEPKQIARHFYELRNRALEEAARNVYESWKGGTMDDFLRDMVELGKALNARKEE